MTTTQELLANRTDEQRALDDGVKTARDFLSRRIDLPFLFVRGVAGVRAINEPAMELSGVLRQQNPALHDTVLNSIFTSSAIGCRAAVITRAKATGDDLVMLPVTRMPS